MEWAGTHGTLKSGLANKSWSKKRRKKIARKTKVLTGITDLFRKNF
jgi:hypothetical protein